MATSEAAQTSASSPSGLGPLIRLRLLNPNQLPSHPTLGSHDDGKGHISIDSFATNALDEAETFMTTYLPSKFELKGSDKRSPPSNAPVELFAKDIPSSSLPKHSGVPQGTTEHWFARKSVHENKAVAETANWPEFDDGLRRNHSQNEMGYTPDVVDAHEVLSWNSQLWESGGKIGQWEDVQMSVFEMCHKVPAPLNKRVFPVVVITARKATPPHNEPGCSFLVVQIPVSLEGVSNAKYHNVPKVTEGIYCAIERGELVEEGKKVMWQMATASDAKGVLPMWAQKMGVPGAVIKDVGLFIKWAEERRTKDGWHPE
jgi:hypothetical protein